MDSSLTFAQLSDLHLSSPGPARLRDLLGKRALGYLSWRLRRRRRHRSEVLAALVSDVLAMAPDQIAITGDLTQIGLPAEFGEARRWLEDLGPPSQVMVVPGNHEAYAPAAWEVSFGRWAPYLASDPPGPGADDPDAVFPSLRIRGMAAFVGLSTARASSPLLAVGRVGKEQLHRLERILAETRRQGLFRVVLLHHPPLPGAVRWRKRLTDAGALRGVLAREGVELVLHGHAHRASVAQLETFAGPAPVVGVSAGGGAGHKHDGFAGYHLYRLRCEGGRWDLGLTSRRYSPAAGRFITEEGPRTLLRRSPTARQ